MAAASSPNGEKMIRIVNEHWIKYIFPCFVYLTLLSMSILLFFLAGYTAHHSLWISEASFFAALLLFLGTHHWFFILLLSESASHVVVTSRRVVWIRERLFSHEQMIEYAYEKMKTVEAHKRGFLQTLLRYGSLHFESGPDIYPVPHTNNVAKDIQQAMGMN